MPTEAEVGYRDAIRQVERCLQRRLKSLHESSKEGTNDSDRERLARISELEHMLEIIESLRR